MTNLDNWQEDFIRRFHATTIRHPKFQLYRGNGLVPLSEGKNIIKFITTLLQAQRELVRDEMSNEFRAAHLTLDKAFDQGVEWGRKLQREENNELKWTLTPQKNETK